MTREQRARDRYLKLAQDANLADSPEDYANAMAYAFGYLRCVDDLLGRDAAQAIVDAASSRIIDVPSVRGIIPLELAMDGRRTRFVIDVSPEAVH